MINNKYWYVVLLAGCVLLSTAFVSAKDVTKKDHRKLDVTFEFKIDVTGSRSTIFELTSLVPESVAGRQVVGKVHYSPEPKKIFQRNGNTYASWKFSGSYIPKRVEMRCIIDLERYKFKNQHGGKKLRAKERRLYLRREQYIDVNKSGIKKAARSVGKFKTDSELARALTIFVLKRMRPSKAARKALGGERALKVRKGDCTEYSDLLVSLARQRGLPAKHVSGYMVGKSSNIGHSWVEIFTRDKGWLRVDALQIDMRNGNFKELRNKYVILSDLRSDPVLKNGMLFSWNVTKGKGAKVLAGLKVRDLN